MPSSTYSINVNTIYETQKLPSIIDALYLLPDNTSKLISPKDVRDAFFTAWENSVFKITTGSHSYEYIGLDRDDIKLKMLFGKKKNGNLDVLNSSLLNYNINDTDIFFYNNKDSFINNNTKISILAGTLSYLYNVAPYLNAYVTNSSIDFEIVNPSGNVIIESDNAHVIINNIIFPTKNQTLSALNGQVLRYYNGYLVFDDNTISISNIGAPNTVTNIYGSPVLINGYSIELTESRPIISTFGHIYTGLTFSNAPIVEVVRQMLYPYLPPIPSIMVNVGNGFTSTAVAEKGSPINATISWSVIKRSDPIISSNITNVLSYTPINISTPGIVTISSPPYYVGVTTSSTFSVQYVFSVTDNGATNYQLTSSMSQVGPITPQTYQVSARLQLVYPIFYGVYNSSLNMGAPLNSNPSHNNFLNTTILPNLTKLIQSPNLTEANVQLSGTGYVYFLYPSSYGEWMYGGPTLSSIKDENGYELLSSFTYSQFTSVNSPNSYWSNISYHVYRTKHPILIGTPNPVVWSFKFNI